MIVFAEDSAIAPTHKRPHHLWNSRNVTDAWACPQDTIEIMIPIPVSDSNSTLENPTLPSRHRFIIIVCVEYGYLNLRGKDGENGKLHGDEFI